MNEPATIIHDALTLATLPEGAPVTVHDKNVVRHAKCLLYRICSDGYMRDLFDNNGCFVVSRPPHKLPECHTCGGKFT